MVAYDPFLRGLHPVGEGSASVPEQRAAEPALRSALPAEIGYPGLERGTTSVAHLDVTLREPANAGAFWKDDPVTALAAHGVEASFEPE